MREHQIRLDDIIQLIQEQLATGQNVTFSPNGISMLPTIKEGRDIVTLSSPPPCLQKYDIVLYRRDSGQYVLHRVVRVGKTYTMMGDNQTTLEQGISHGQIIALCTAIRRKGKLLDTRAWGIRGRGVLFYHTRHLRRIWRGFAERYRRLFSQ